MIFENGKYREPTEAELKAAQEGVPTECLIAELKQNLLDTDYKAIKYAEGLISEAEYAETKALRQEWREEINRLENEK